MKKHGAVTTLGSCIRQRFLCTKRESKGALTINMTNVMFIARVADRTCQFWGRGGADSLHSLFCFAVFLTAQLRRNEINRQAVFVLLKKKKEETSEDLSLRSEGVV